jgi:cellulose synthase (UDP-forming)
MRVYLFRWAGLLHLIAGVMYLYWRLTAGLMDLGSLLFWGAELYVWLAAVGFTLSRYPQVPRETIPSPEVLRRSFFQLPRVDVLVLRQWDSRGGNPADGALGSAPRLPVGAVVCPHCGSGRG